MGEVKPKTTIRAAYISHTPFDENRVGAAAVYCSDGRYGEQMDEFLHEGLRLPRYDRVAVPGGAACLAGHMMSSFEKTALERQLEFLVREHQLNKVILIAHEGCAFYKNLWLASASVKHQQFTDLQKAADLIRQWNAAVEVQSFFARRIQGKVVFERWTGKSELPLDAAQLLTPAAT